MGYQVQENAYGHLKRVEWIAAQLPQRGKICELGCGTGAMVVSPLSQKGFDVCGVDIDSPSIRFGREFFQKEGVDAPLYEHLEWEGLKESYDAIIVSEVLEHLADSDYPSLFQTIREKLKPGGILFVTVPNGYGWFELESHLYFQKKWGKRFEGMKIPSALNRFKKWVLKGRAWENQIPSSLSQTPHVQRYTYRSIRQFLTRQGFQIRNMTGSVLFAGPFSDHFFSGLSPLMRFNNFLGTLFPWIASGFYLSLSLSSQEVQQRSIPPHS